MHAKVSGLGSVRSCFTVVSLCHNLLLLMVISYFPTSLLVHLVMDLILPFKDFSWIMLLDMVFFFFFLISCRIILFWMWCLSNACFLRTEMPAVLNYDIL